MPVFQFSSYDDRFNWLRIGHIETVYPAMFRHFKDVHYQRERIDTPDDDFLDLDWIKGGFQNLVIISHGLEGSSERQYVKSCARYFHQHGFDVLAWNYRSCSGEMNKQLRLYHHGVTDDLETVVNHCVDHGKYKNMVLVGFSMGGSTTLKYLGEAGITYPKHIVAAATFSVPCNLWDSALELTNTTNYFYRRRFLKKMIQKIKDKHKLYPDQIDISGIDAIDSFGVFDERYTAPLHGFRNARHFYTTSSSDMHYHSIRVPCLIVNAKNDPLLGEKCYPYDLCKENKFVHLETPKTGGHVGFTLMGKKHNWMDFRAHQFISKFMRV